MVFAVGFDSMVSAAGAGCIIRGLLQSGAVVKFWPHNLHYSPGYTDALQDLGVEVAYGGDSSSFRQWLVENGDDIDHALLCRPQVADAFLPELKAQAKIAHEGERSNSHNEAGGCL